MTTFTSETAPSVLTGDMAQTLKNGVCGSIFFGLFFFGHGIVHADQFNDLYYIDPGGVPDLTEEGQQSGSGGPGSGSGNSNIGTTGDSGSSAGSSTAGEDTSAGGDSGGGDTTGDGGSGNDTGGSGRGIGETHEETEENTLESLIEDGGLSGGLGGVDGGLFSGGDGSIVVNGSRVRAFLRKDPDIEEVLRYWKIGKGKTRPDGKTTKDRLTPGEYYALVAATLSADDERLQEARFTARDFGITYRSRGALFAFIPFSFPVRVNVQPYAPVAERVAVRFPWYHWFVREYFTRQSLAEEVNTVLETVVKNASEGEDIHAELFEAVALFLRQKVRTITDSIILQ